jgi:uncharacterized protein YjiS (DUF1127 family)
MTTLTQTLRPVSHALGGVAGAVRGFVTERLVAPVLHRLEERRQYESLATMDEHLLRDLGITRGEIDHVFRHGATYDR